MKTRFVSLLAVFLILATFAPLNIKSAEAAGSDRTPVRGIDYLNGYGVDVKLHPTDSPPYDFSKYGQGKYGGNYQCFELVVRLYAEVLGYDRWKAGDAESKHRWPINPKSGQIMTPADMVGVVQYADTAKSSDPDYAIFKDLEYYQNGSATPPRPGDIIIYNANGIGDHTGIISRVGGNKIEIIEQNWSLAGKRTLKLTYEKGGYKIEYTMGWIHSPRMDSLLTVNNMKSVSPSGNYTYFGGFQWNRDRDTVYVYLSQKATENLGNNSNETGTLKYLLEQTNALKLTESRFSQCIVNNVTSIIIKGYQPNLKSLDLAIKYAGQTTWVRAWWKDGSNSGWSKIDNIRCAWDGNSY